MYYTKLMFCGFFIAIFRETTTINHDIFKKEIYCGKKLVNILTQFCLELPTHHHTGVLVLSRNKRQVVKECCRNKCSLSYLLENYCEKVNTIALEAFVNISDNKTTNVQVDNPNLTTPSTPFTSIKSSFHKRQRRRRKRNCKCRELLNRTQVLNKELPKLLHKENVPESEIGQIEFLQKPFYVFLT